MKEQRIQQIEKYIHSKGTVSLDELCEQFDVSKNTIRRDINKIVKDGEIKKVYGGVMSLSDELVPFENRNTSYSAQKELIAKKAAELIEDNDLIFLDSGTTVCYIPKYIDEHKNITIITNSLTVVNETLNKENFKVIIVGNTLKRKTNSFVNVDSWDNFNRYNIDKAFLAATGISVDKGATNSDILEYEIKSKIVEKAAENYLLVDHSKFNKVALVTYCPIERLDAIITDGPVPENFKEPLLENQIELIISE